MNRRPPLPRVRSLLIALLLWAAASPSFATTISTTVDRNNVPVGEPLTLTIEVVSDGGTISQPRFDDLSAFDVVSSGSTRNVQVVGGRMSASLTFTYTLVPRDEGQFTIGPAKVTIGGADHLTDPVTVNVTPSRTRRDEPARPEERPTQGQPKPTGDRRVFISAELDRDTAYVNQPITYIFRFFQGERLLSNPEYTKPSFPGFWVEDLPPQRKYSTVIDGIRYEVTEIRYALFPTDAGTKTIGETRLKATVSSGRRTRSNDPFSIFGNDPFFGFDRGEALNLTTRPVTLAVLPHPADGRPANFSGLVGAFSLRAESDLRTVSVGDPLTVKVTLSGEGNIKAATAPVFDSVPGLRTFAAGSSEEVSTAGYKISGRKSFDQVFVPQRPGTYRIPPFSLSYFDPVARRYRTIQTEPIEFTATGTATDFTIPSLRLSPDELSDLAADVRFIHTDGTDLRRITDPGLFGWPFWAGHLLPFAGLVGFLAWRRRAIRIAADPVGQKRRRAYRTAIECLESTNGKVTGGEGVFEIIANALLRYYGDRFNRPASGARRQDIRADLSRDGVPDPQIAEYLSLLDECDRCRYARAADARAADAAERARRVLAGLEEARR